MDSKLPFASLKERHTIFDTISDIVTSDARDISEIEVVELSLSHFAKFLELTEADVSPKYKDALEAIKKSAKSFRYSIYQFEFYWRDAKFVITPNDMVRPAITYKAKHYYLMCTDTLGNKVLIPENRNIAKDAVDLDIHVEESGKLTKYNLRKLIKQATETQIKKNPIAVYKRTSVYKDGTDLLVTVNNNPVGGIHEISLNITDGVISPKVVFYIPREVSNSQAQEYLKILSEDGWNIQYISTPKEPSDILLNNPRGLSDWIWSDDPN